MADFKFEIGEVIRFDTGKWGVCGQGNIIAQQEYPSCNTYLVESECGKLQVREDEVL